MHWWILPHVAILFLSHPHRCMCPHERTIFFPFSSSFHFFAFFNFIELFVSSSSKKEHDTTTRRIHIIYLRMVTYKNRPLASYKIERLRAGGSKLQRGCCAPMQLCRLNASLIMECVYVLCSRTIVRTYKRRDGRLVYSSTEFMYSRMRMERYR